MSIETIYRVRIDFRYPPEPTNAEWTNNSNAYSDWGKLCEFLDIEVSEAGSRMDTFELDGGAPVMGIDPFITMESTDIHKATVAQISVRAAIELRGGTLV